jgi:hypothetical protein
VQLPDAFKDFITQHTDGKAPSKELMTHCRRELAHAQWNILLDDEFIEAYKHGIIIECCDGIKRRFYPRILTYSADYPEKYVTPIHSCYKLCITVGVIESSLLVSAIREFVRARGASYHFHACKTWA